MKRTNINNAYKNSFKKFAQITLAILLLITGLWGWYYLHKPTTLSIQNVDIAGQIKHLNRSELQQVILPYANTGFFSVNIDALKQRLLAIPWVAHVSITRIWPNTLKVIIQEQQPIAIWNHKSLITANGTVYTPDLSTIPTKLPNFIAPQDEEKIMLSAYDLINKTLQPYNVRIQTLILSQRLSWRVVLSNGLKINIGQQDAWQRWLRFMGVYQKLFEKNASSVNYVDMRYPNGMAVSWK